MISFMDIQHRKIPKIFSVNITKLENYTVIKTVQISSLQPFIHGNQAFSAKLSNTTKRSLIYTLISNYKYIFPLLAEAVIITS